MRRMTLTVTLLALAFACTSLAASAQDHHGHEAPTGGVQALSAPLREALSQEMVHLQSGMMTMVPAFASGDWALIAETARKIEQSFILAQALTAEQLDELHHALPPEFLALDAEFHYLAGMLGHAADNRKPELAAFYYSRMLESCNACHAQFATEKFPALARPDDEPAHGHHHH
jgi:hypothetical protein